MRRDGTLVLVSESYSFVSLVQFAAACRRVGSSE